MRGQRSKQYRKLMKQYEMLFGFREDYQVLLDAEMIQDAARFQMDLIGGLERTLHGKVKPSRSQKTPLNIYPKLIVQVITQCSIRHLYNSENKNEALIEQAKTYERRRCNHHLLDEPLSTLDCLKSVVDSKENLTNKHRYVVASQDGRVRAHMRQIPGVPMVVSVYTGSAFKQTPELTSHSISIEA
jgi:U3 small nucleolar RNA-associated protein 23